MKKNQRTMSKKLGLLWLITGILIGLFISSLSFLKKHTTVVEGKTVTARHETVETSPDASKNAKPVPVVHKKVATTSGADTTNDQYDFYTMLPKMQVKQTNGADNTSATTTSPSPEKPKKSLASAEESMLSPHAPAAPTAAAAAPIAPTAINTPAAAPTSSSPTLAPVAPPAHTANTATTRYHLILGSFNNYKEADALKAQLLLAGIEKTRIDRITKNNVKWYRVTLGPYPSEAKARHALAEIQSSQFNGVVEPLNP